MRLSKVNGNYQIVLNNQKDHFLHEILINNKNHYHLIPKGICFVYTLIPMCIKISKKYTYKKVSRTGRIDEKVCKCKEIFPNGVFCKEKF